VHSLSHHMRTLSQHMPTLSTHPMLTSTCVRLGVGVLCMCVCACTWWRYLCRALGFKSPAISSMRMNAKVTECAGAARFWTNLLCAQTEEALTKFFELHSNNT